MADTLLEGFPVVVALPVAWADMDAYGHVNNVVYFRYFEAARLEYFRRLGCFDLARARGVGPIVHSTRCRFRRPLAWPDTVRVGCRVTDVGADRFVVGYALASEAHAAVAAEGSAVIVTYDYDRGAKAPVSEELRAAVARVEGKPCPSTTSGSSGC